MGHLREMARPGQLAQPDRIRAIAAQHLVGPLPVKQHSHAALAGQVHHAPLGENAGRLERLVLVPYKLLQVVPEPLDRGRDVVARRARALHYLLNIVALIPGAI